MTELLQRLSDDQTAILGCLAALGASMLALSISFHANPANRQAPRTEAEPAADARPETRRRAA